MATLKHVALRTQVYKMFIRYYSMMLWNSIIHVITCFFDVETVLRPCRKLCL